MPPLHRLPLFLLPLLVPLLLPSGCTSPRIRKSGIQLPVWRDSSSKPVMVEIINPGPPLNSRWNDYAPFLSHDGLTLYFVSDRPGGYGKHDIWFATRESIDGIEFSEPEPLPSPINSSVNEGPVCFSADGRTIFFTACNRSGGSGICDIFTADYGDDGWTNARPVSEINTPNWESQPTLSPEGSLLFFLSDRPDTNGIRNVDILVAERLPNGGWDTPRILDPPINSDEREDSPLYTRQGLFFFSSNRTGNFDLYVSAVDSLGNLGPPTRLVDGINTHVDERYIAATADGSILFFSSERADENQVGKLDIYMIREAPAEHDSL